jgi:pimeloyl-ACP methyl ester carboxylesterase
MPRLEAIELPLPWGPIVRGFRWGGGLETVFLLHEPGSDVDAWGTLPLTIARTLEMQTIAIDLPGHGLSDDPWDPARLPELLPALLRANLRSVRRFMIAAGVSATTALAEASELGLSGVIGLTPETPATGWSPDRSPTVPKLFVAGSMAGNDLETARRLSTVCGGWGLVTSLPVSARGTELLTSEWDVQLAEEIVAFLRNCRRPAQRSTCVTPTMP